MAMMVARMPIRTTAMVAAITPVVTTIALPVSVSAVLAMVTRLRRGGDG